MNKIMISTTVLMLALTGCAAQSSATPKTEASTATASEAATPAAPVTSIDAKKEVAYLCGAKNNDPLRVMYGFQGDHVVAAQVLYKEQASPVLYRDNTSQDLNVFTSDSGITWTAALANATNVDKVDGNMLTQPGKEVVNGKETIVTQIVTKYCKLDKKGTAKLQQTKP